ncbi:MAG TPA: DIP1984 family protein [Thermomicrobiales bacterium]|nr:DIP1984 family protein [Thermomicrobiales bacterium]HRA46485.1 DIP1984 family protein [Thermomicrobiales bacterium]
MKLAEALILRADLQKRIEDLRSRMTRNAKVQEGEQPVEDPGALLREFDAAADRLQELVQQINRTNATRVLAGDDQISISDAIVDRDSLRLRHGMYSGLCEAATVEMTRYSRSEIKSVPSFDVRIVRVATDGYAVRSRELDARIQATNWLVDLVE